MDRAVISTLIHGRLNNFYLYLEITIVFPFKHHSRKLTSFSWHSDSILNMKRKTFILQRLTGFFQKFRLRTFFLYANRFQLETYITENAILNFKIWKEYKQCAKLKKLIRTSFRFQLPPIKHIITKHRFTVRNTINSDQNFFNFTKMSKQCIYQRYRFRLSEWKKQESSVANIYVSVCVCMTSPTHSNVQCPKVVILHKQNAVWQVNNTI